ncbi:MAG: extracellular solute-binding protein, partial [Deltaproteobacteria bacterium]|nr:extracellular solute-binding protein [Deltaproteobacteria bacterium]
LDAKRKGSPIAAVYPTDGPALIPSPIAILSSTKQPELARQLYDFMLTEEAQKSIVRGRMYSPVLEVCPTDARPFRLVLASSLQWNAKVMEEIFAQRDEIKKKFISVVLN